VAWRGCGYGNPGNRSDIKDEIETLRVHFGDYDFFYVHVKDTDSSGEDGDFSVS